MNNWQRRRYCSFRAFLLRQALKLNYRYWQKCAAVDMESVRAREANLSRRLPQLPQHVTIIDQEIYGVNTHRVVVPGVSLVRIVLYLHGGGFIAGSPITSHRDFIWRLGESCNATVVAVDYRKAPEFPFPAALDDAAVVYRALLENHPASAIAVIGDSAGAGLGLSLVHRLRDEGVDLPGAVVALSPWADLVNSSDSIARNMDTERMVPAHLLNEIAALYAGMYNLMDPYVSPLYGNFRDFPACLILASDSEALSDDSVRLEEKMKAAGAPVVLQMWSNLPHVWPVFAGIVPESRAALEQVAMFVDGHLRTTQAVGMQFWSDIVRQQQTVMRR